jgi:BirA family transcriptional regulator, biotin operon repressor / biotin---[acetyl-CoA-carboxylase] ligase
VAAVPAPKPLSSEFSDPLARVAQRLGYIASRVLWFDEVGSTNDVAVALAERGEVEGTVVVADEQVAGRGRLGRTWASPAGAGLYMSVILRPPPATHLLTLAAGVGVANGVQRATGLVVELKWPNDLYVGTRKLAGILAEGGASAGSPPFVVVGIGINVLSAAYPTDVASRATSVEAELGRPVERGPLLAEVLAGFAESYSNLVNGRSGLVLHAWRSRARRLLGRPVQWEEGRQVLSGVARDIDDTGALVVETEAGVRRVIAGEVRWR